MVGLSVFFITTAESGRRVDGFSKQGRYTYVFENGRGAALRNKRTKEIL